MSRAVRLRGRDVTSAHQSGYAGGRRVGRRVRRMHDASASYETWSGKTPTTSRQHTRRVEPDVTKTFRGIYRRRA
ncbi:hypothetical protein B0H12DRAFT_1103880 [Mycena haematopus]|nr:hypothetical protein B0H12DRAFT_1103880 [Mycena haematopus]